MVAFQTECLPSNPSSINLCVSGEDLYGWINNHMCSLWKQISILEPPPDIFTADFSGPLAVWIWVSFWMGCGSMS